LLIGNGDSFVEFFLHFLAKKIKIVACILFWYHIVDGKQIIGIELGGYVFILFDGHSLILIGVFVHVDKIIECQYDIVPQFPQVGDSFDRNQELSHNLLSLPNE